MHAWFRDDYGAHTFKTTTSKGPPCQSVVRRITMDPNSREILEALSVKPSRQQFYYAPVPGGPRDILTILHYLARPAASSEPSSDEMQSIYVSSVPFCHNCGQIHLILARGLYGTVGLQRQIPKVACPLHQNSSSGTLPTPPLPPPEHPPANCGPPTSGVARGTTL